MKGWFLLFIFSIGLITCSNKKDYTIPNIEKFVSSSEHVLPYKVKWKTNKMVNGIKVKSTFLLKDRKLKKISKIFDNSKALFFEEFKNTTCNLGPLKIRIISTDMLINRKYFNHALPSNFGRYFRTYNTIYVIYDVFKHPEYLSHELSHYFYDECGIKFKSNKEEHIKVYKFQDFYKRKYN